VVLGCNAGGTEEYSIMVEEVRKSYPDSTFIAVGFSMGGNVITKYLGERPERQLHFIGAVCCCQGYDVAELVHVCNSFLISYLF
jgi:abhydrolase domain-containing protein 2